MFKLKETDREREIERKRKKTDGSIDYEQIK